MKTLSQLQVGDFLYNIDGDRYEVEEVSHYLNKKQSESKFLINCNYRNYQTISNTEKTSASFCMTHGYLTHQMLFTTKYEAMISKKRILLNDLYLLKEKAEAAVAAVVGFRIKHFDDLNEHLTDSALRKLKAQI